MHKHSEGDLRKTIAPNAKFFTKDRRVNGIVELHKAPQALESVELQAAYQIYA